MPILIFCCFNIVCLNLLINYLSYLHTVKCWLKHFDIRLIIWFLSALCHFALHFIWFILRPSLFMYYIFIDKTFISYSLTLSFLRKSYELKLIICMYSFSKLAIFSPYYYYFICFTLTRVFKCQTYFLEKNYWINKEKKKTLIKKEHSTIVVNNSCEMQSDITKYLKTKKKKIFFYIYVKVLVIFFTQLFCVKCNPTIEGV